jgi:protein-S-isoprenylcysteine O-methyltransferase Ste14
LTPLRIHSSVFTVGPVLAGIGLAGLVTAMMNYRDTPEDQSVTKGLYRVSRHPQIVALFVIFLGICVAIGSWVALSMLVVSKAFQHFGILAEEEVCLRRCGEPYRAFMKRVRRYHLFL